MESERSLSHDGLTVSNEEELGLPGAEEVFQDLQLKTLPQK